MGMKAAFLEWGGEQGETAALKQMFLTREGVSL
jgi:hypothetical protein